MTQDDNPLIERCIKKDPLAWAELVRRYSNLIGLSIANIFKKYSFPYSRSDVDDVRQNLLISIWKDGKLNTIKNRREISYWIAVSSGNMALDYMRSRSTKERYDTLSMHESPGESLLNELAESLPSGKPTPLDEAHRKEISKSLNLFLEDLPHSERIIAKLNIFHEMTYDQIARITHRPIGTVSSAAKRARDELRRRLKKYLQ